MLKQFYHSKPLNFNKALCADDIATVAGACLGTSTVTTVVECGTGVAAGGKTVFASVIIAGMFLLAIFILRLYLKLFHDWLSLAD